MVSGAIAEVAIVEVLPYLADVVVTDEATQLRIWPISYIYEYHFCLYKYFSFLTEAVELLTHWVAF